MIFITHKCDREKHNRKQSQDPRWRSCYLGLRWPGTALLSSCPLGQELKGGKAQARWACGYMDVPGGGKSKCKALFT